MCACFSLLVIESVNNPLKMSNPNKKKRKRSFLDKLRNVFKKKDELEGQTEFYRQVETVSNQQTDNLESVSCNFDQKIAPETTNNENSETYVTVKNDSSEKEKYKYKNLSDMQKDCKNVIIGKNENSRCNIIADNQSADCEKYNVTENKQDSKLGSDRYINTKIEFLKQENVNITSQLYLEDTDKLFHNNKTKSPDSNSAMLQPFSNNASVSSDTCKFLVKETKAVSQESSEDSDFSADSTEDSFEESSEDENERIIESEKIQKYFKDDYFTKGKYITYFFLEMERQFYNPLEVYSMVQYHDTASEKPGKEGIIRYTKFICCLKF